MNSSINWPEKNDSFNYIITNLVIEKNVNEGNVHATTDSLIRSMHVRMITHPSDPPKVELVISLNALLSLASLLPNPSS
jgi:hypothetical protein